ncbi:MAG: hypothetical protein LBQ30_03020, partial [Treponema sp.]|nr:hypothetical protein [Treponema sp.]
YRGGNRDYGKVLDIKVSLINSNGKTIATTTKIFFQSIKYDFGNGAGYGSSILTKGAKLELNYDEPVGGTSYKYVVSALNQPTVFKAIPADDITDNLTIKIDSVNGINIEDINNHIKISTGKIKVKLYDERRGVWVEVLL